jgi:nucleoside 2-deoxyribosyltransferase
VYEDLEALAGLRIGRTIDRVAKAHAEKLVQVNTDYAARGLANSGPIQTARLNLALDATEEISREVANTWRDLIKRKDGRLTKESVAFIMTKVTAIAHTRIASFASAHQAREGTAPPSWLQVQLAAGIQTIVANIRRDLEIERREADLFPPESPASNREAFVIIAADSSLESLYQQVIAPSIQANGLQPFRMTDREPTASISNEILSRIDRARLVVADLTFERPNCYYEVGYAQAKGKKVVFAARCDHDPRRPSRRQNDPKVHFDLDSHRFSFWEDGDWESLRTQLTQRIGEALRVLESSSTTGAKRDAITESEVLNYFQKAQSSVSGQALLYDHLVAQELGWPLDEVRLVLNRLVEKGHIERSARGFVLKTR